MKGFLNFCLIQCLLLIGAVLQAEIIIDGKLDEDEWSEARQITTFYEVFPYTLNPVTDIKTEPPNMLGSGTIIDPFVP